MNLVTEPKNAGRTIARNVLRIPVEDREEVAAYAYMAENFTLDLNGKYTNRADATMAGILAEDVILRWCTNQGADVQLRRKNTAMGDFRMGTCNRVELKTNYSRGDSVWEDWSLIVQDRHVDKAEVLLFAVYCAGPKMLNVLGLCTPAEFKERASYVPQGHLFPNGAVCNGPSSLVVQGFRWLTPLRDFLEQQGAL